MKQERYNSKGELQQGVEGAKVRHFTPEKDGRDRFGNRLFVSKDLSYIDSSREKVQAGILISPEGWEFTGKNVGILTKIDRALSQLEDAKGKVVSYRTIDLGDGNTIKNLATGGQSNVYVLTVRGQKYAIKTHRPDRYYQRKGFRIPTDINQPYINEMLQTQSMAADLQSDLASRGIIMSTFLFASGQVSCTKYEEDENNANALTKQRLKDLQRLADQYISQQYSQGNHLWDYITVDVDLDNAEWFTKAQENFRTKADGTIVWIDPFVFNLPMI